MSESRFPQIVLLGVAAWLAGGGAEPGKLGAEAPVTRGLQPLCSPARELACQSSDTWSNSGTGSTDVITSYNCSSSLTYSGPEFVYSHVAPGDGLLTVVLTGLGADLDLIALQAAVRVIPPPGCNPDDQCVADSAAGGSQDEEVSFTATGGETYYFVVDGYNGAISSYTLLVECEAIFADGFESGDFSAWSAVL